MSTRWKPRIGTGTPRLHAPLLGVLIALGMAPLGVQTRPLVYDEAQPAPFLWKIEGQGKPTYLFGTIHVPDARVVKLPAAVEQAFGASQAVFTEIRMDPATQMGVQAKLMLPDDQHLKDVVGQPLYDRLSKAVDRSLPKDAPPGVGMLLATMLDRLKPWVAMSYVELAEFLPDMMAGRQPLDTMLYDRARSEGKETGGLETIDEQLAIFDALTMDEQVRMLKITLDTMDEAHKAGRSASRELIDGYVSGDLDKLAAMSNDSMKGEPELQKKFMARALDGRNLVMVDRLLAKRAERPTKTCFFAVGTLHYAGAEGILALLEKKGLKVTRVVP